MTTFEIIQIIIMCLLVPWNSFLTVYAIISVRDRSALATRLEERKGLPCSIHNDVMVRIDSKLESLAQSMAEMNGYLKGREDMRTGTKGAKGLKGEKGERGEHG